jgi:hypothetical protein
LIGPYETSQAFRVGLEARLSRMAQEEGVDLQRLQRQVAFDRLLARLFVQDDPPWLLKGGYALELRFAGRARSTRDLDLSVLTLKTLQSPVSAQRSRSAGVHVVERLRQAAERDLGDGFEFVISGPAAERRLLPAGTMRCLVEARLAGRVFVRFHVDLGPGEVVIDDPDWVEGRSWLSFVGISPARIALFPLAQQFAEKVHAYTFPWQDRDNTRVKDLVDLVLLVTSVVLAPDRLRRALKVTFEIENTHPLPARLPTPPPDWAEPYAALARDLGLPALTMTEAYAYLDSIWQEWDLGRVGSQTIEGSEP